MFREYLERYLKDPLYRNSFFLASSRYLAVGAGFFYWVVAAKFYPTEDVGIGAALISSLGFVIMLSRVGLDAALVRFLPGGDRKSIFNTVLAVTTVTTMATGIVYILVIGLFAPSLAFLREPSYGMAFLIFAVMNSLVAVCGTAFLALRKGLHYFVQNVLLVLRIPLLIPLVFLGSFGVLSAIGLAYLLASVVSLSLVHAIVGLGQRMDKGFLKDSLSFSSGNYFSTILASTPTLIMPMLLLNLVGEAETAKYYISFAVGSLIMIIPDTFSAMLFVEGSHGRDLKKIVRNAALATYSLLVPAVLFVGVFGDSLLGMIGRDYAGASGLLTLIAISGLFYAICAMFISVQNVRMRVRSIVKLNLLRFVLLLGLSYIFVLEDGIIGVGYGWVIAYGSLAFVVGVAAKGARYLSS